MASNFHIDQQQSKNEPGSKWSLIVQRDKKRFTERGARLVESTNVKNLMMFRADELSVYAGIAKIHAIVAPDCMIISYDQSKSEKTDFERGRLLANLANGWNTCNKPFDMTTEFPGSGTHVVVQVNVGPEMERDEALLKSALSKIGNNLAGKMKSLRFEDSLQKALTRNVVYHRGVITKVNAGCDSLSAGYEIFLYDCGILAAMLLEDIRPLTTEQQELYTPVFRILRIPGLSPLAKTYVLENLHKDKPQHQLRKAETWPPSTLELISDLLKGHALQVTLFAEQGLYLYGDIKMVNWLDDTKETVDMKDFQDSEKFEHYSVHLTQKSVVYIDEKLLCSTLLLDAEDDEFIDWVACSQISDY